MTASNGQTSIALEFGRNQVAGKIERLDGARIALAGDARAGQRTDAASGDQRGDGGEVGGDVRRGVGDGERVGSDNLAERRGVVQRLRDGECERGVPLSVRVIEVTCEARLSASILAAT